MKKTILLPVSCCLALALGATQAGVIKNCSEGSHLNKTTNKCEFDNPNMKCSKGCTPSKNRKECVPFGFMEDKPNCNEIL